MYFQRMSFSDYFDFVIAASVPVCLEVVKCLPIQSKLNNSNLFGTMEICSRYGYFESLRVNHGDNLETSF